MKYDRILKFQHFLLISFNLLFDLIEDILKTFLCIFQLIFQYLEILSYKIVNRLLLMLRVNN